MLPDGGLGSLHHRVTAYNQVDCGGLAVVVHDVHFLTIQILLAFGSAL